MNTIEYLIADFQERPLPVLTNRDIDIPIIPGKADVVIGMRRSGKTYLLFQELQRLMSAGVQKQNLLYINLEDDRLDSHTPGLLDAVLETFFRNNPEVRSQESHLFLDEIQVVPDWERFIRRVLDTENAHIYLTGSSAKMLVTEVSTVLRGRGISVEVLPFSFSESAIHAGIDVSSHLPPGAQLRSKLEAHCLQYLEQGGFPEVQNIDERNRIRILQDYVELVVMRDIIERHGIENIAAAKVFSHTLLQMVGRLFSVNKTYNNLKSRGVKVGKDTLHLLLDYLSDAYLLFTVPIFRKSPQARAVNPRKVYAVDPGLVRAMSHVSTVDLGARLENAVYLELRRRYGDRADGEISYHKTASNREIDFVVGNQTDGSVQKVVQVCSSLKESETREREIEALMEGMPELDVSEVDLVTLSEEGIIETEAGIVRLVPAWRWLLSQ
ncbi:ATP-binding protein [Gemmatimonadota bacterium]